MSADAVAVVRLRPAAISSTAFDEIHHRLSLLFSRWRQRRDGALDANEKELDCQARDEYSADTSKFAEQHVGGTCEWVDVCESTLVGDDQPRDVAAAAAFMHAVRS